MENKKTFHLDREQEWEVMGGGISRKIMGYDETIMMVKVQFEEGGVGAPHEHYHAQTTYVVEGTFEMTIGDETKMLKGGDSFYIPPHVVHGVICREKGMLIDVFSPVREDFLDGSKVSYFGTEENA
ncbi:cupin domain-containing protein [Algivirga pacifica]|uniref:Cupin domain-containing protein n=1 Tax=Algivirga pacifica TaxID=1162670 RepID=A0ABP9DJ81_9BACT